MSEGHHRRWPWITVGVLTLLIAAGAVLVYRLRDEVTEVTIDEAVAEFEQSRASPSPSPSTPTTATASDGTITTDVDAGSPLAPAERKSIDARPAPDESAAPDDPVAGFILPAEGVYEYTTIGSETVDALGGARHDYPPLTAVVVRHAGCGVEIAWTPFQERRESWIACPTDGGLAITSFGSDHEWFGTADTRSLTCDPAAWLAPPDGAPAGELVATCSGDGLTDVRTLTIVGPTTVEVGGTAVGAIEVRIDVATTGSTNGTSTRLLVLDATTGLPLRWTDDVTNTTPTPIGDVHYTESFTLELTSITPRR